MINWIGENNSTEVQQNMSITAADDVQSMPANGEMAKHCRNTMKRRKLIDCLVIVAYVLVIYYLLKQINQ